MASLVYFVLSIFLLLLYFMGILSGVSWMSLVLFYLLDALIGVLKRCLGCPWFCFICWAFSMVCMGYVGYSKWDVLNVIGFVSSTGCCIWCFISDILDVIGFCFIY